jgi:hypothetical protein
MSCSLKGKQSGFHSQAILILERNAMEQHLVNAEETKDLPIFNSMLSSSCVKDFSLMLQMKKRSNSSTILKQSCMSS